MAPQPQRIRLSRAKGSNLQAMSESLNGLPAVKVDRSSKFGNPFKVQDARELGFEYTAAHAVKDFDEWLDGSERQWMGKESDDARDAMIAAIPNLKGKNLACWCKSDAPCHADVLIKRANDQ